MLSIGKLGIGQERYYSEKVAEGAEDYYSGEGEAEGCWIGDAAEELGLAGEVDADQLKAMLTGLHPATGEPLTGTQGTPAKGSVPGFDLTFSAPKSVSMLWALGSEVERSAVLSAHERAIEAALHYMQREACWTRRGAGGKEFVHGNGFLGAAYRHRSSRAGDMQLHTHNLIANATKGPDGRWTRLYHPAIYNHAKTAGYIYEAQLRHELARSLGIRWQEVRNGIAEIAGFDDAWLRGFSTRRAQILEAAGEGASLKARQLANLTTREAKEEIARPDLFARWQEKAEEISVDLDRVRGRWREWTGERKVLTVEQIDREVTAGASHFDRREVIQAFGQLLRDGGEAAEIEAGADAFLASDAVLQVGEGPGGPRYTTRRVWELERQALATVERMRREGADPAGEMVAGRVIGQRPTLKADQRAMIQRLLTAREGVVIVIGEAGTGKTYAIVAAAEGWAQVGIELRAAAPTWRAANVMRSEGLAATSIASLLRELDGPDSRGLREGSVLLIDEAGMVDSATTARLIAHADAAGAKLVLVGDNQQLTEIGAGGMLGALAERTEPIYLDEVIRHRHDAEREGAKLIREGEGREALTLYRSEERVIVAPNAEARREAMVRDWAEAFAGGDDALMVAKRNVDVARLNEQARAVMKEQGRLGEHEIEVADLRFAAGEQIITRVNDRRQDIYNRERWQVAEVNAANRKMTLEGIDQARRVEVGAAYLDRANPYGDAPAIEHAYAVTTYCAQGTTVDRAYVMADPSMDKQELYVAASRSREETYLYAMPEIQSGREEFAPTRRQAREDLSHIAAAAQRDGSQSTAHDEALHAEASALPSEVLVERRAELERPAEQAARAANHRQEAVERIEQFREQTAAAEARLAAVEAGGRKARKEQLPEAMREHDWARERLAEWEWALDKRPPANERDAILAELSTVERVLAERVQPQLIAHQLAPPDYIRRELGERPADPGMRKSWERGVSQIETFRHEHGVTDKSHAFGDPKTPHERAAREQAQRRLRETQRQLGMRQARERQVERGMEIGL